VFFSIKETYARCIERKKQEKEEKAKMEEEMAEKLERDEEERRKKAKNKIRKEKKQKMLVTGAKLSKVVKKAFRKKKRFGM